MARFYLRSDLTLDLSQGTPATLGSGSVSSTTFVEVLRFTRTTLAGGLASSSVPCSVDMASVSAATLEWRWRLIRRSGGADQEVSGYSTAHTTTGIKTQTLTLSATWSAGDELVIALELRKVSGGGSRSFTLNVNDADCYVEPTLVVGGGSQATVTAAGSGTGTKALSGAAAAALAALASGAGQKTSQAGSQPLIGLASTGAGQKGGQAGTTQPLVILATGAGEGTHPGETPEGGSISTLEILAAALGTKDGQGGSIGAVMLAADAAGTKFGYGSLVATLEAVAAGTGASAREGGSTAMATLLAALGAGVKPGVYPWLSLAEDLGQPAEASRRPWQEIG